MKKIGFVVLHYCAIDETYKCVDSIFNNLNTDLFHIVIVDNNSPDESGKLLKEHYKNYDNVTVINLEKNLGFSKGNNVGFKYLKNNIACDYIALLNNDVYFLQKNFLDIIEKEYKNSSFAVLGPKILLKNNSINPINEKLLSLSDYKKIRIKLIFHLILSYFNLENLYKKIRQSGNTSNSNFKTDNYLENIILHGCCLIFSPTYINKFDGLDEKTFLYAEEELLYLKLKNNNLKSVYLPQLEIFHNEDQSTNAVTKTKYKKNIFLYKNLLLANKVLIKEISK